MDRELGIRKIIIAGCRKGNLLGLLVAVLVLGLFVGHADLTSDGLRRTQAYLLLGGLIYPLFYGALLFSVWKLSTLYWRADSYVAIEDENLLVWSKKIPLHEVSSVSVRRGPFFLQWLVIGQKDGAETKVSSIALTKPVAEVAARVKAAAK